MSRADLHVHTSASDGRFSPSEIIHKAAELGISVIAISDHDTVDGVAPALEAAKAFPELMVIPAVEISTYAPSGEVHVLGYFVDYTNTELLDTLERFKHSRRERAQKMINRLAGLGIHIDWQRVQELAGGESIGRPHIAQAMLEKGYISSLLEAFEKYIGEGKPAYLPRDKVTPAQAVKLILQASGLPVLAHPLTVHNMESLLAELKSAGLVGLEVYYDNYNSEEIHLLTNLANKYNLILTGGSDYHGLNIVTEPMLGSINLPDKAIKQLLDLAKQAR